MGRCTEGGSVGCGFADGLNHFGVGVAKDHRTPGLHVIDVTVAVAVINLRAAGVGDENRVAADRFEGAYRAVDPAGDVFFGFSEKLG